MSKKAIIAGGKAVSKKGKKKAAGKKKPTPRLEHWAIEELRGKGNPLNWRKHPDKQRATLVELIERVGWAGAFIFNERTGRIIDGHLREEVTKAKARVPVFIVDLAEKHERLALATFDTLGLHAEGDVAAFRELREQVDDEWAELTADIDGMFGDVELEMATLEGEIAPGEPEYWVQVEFVGEDEQKKVYEEMTDEGFMCRVMIL